MTDARRIFVDRSREIRAIQRFVVILGSEPGSSTMPSLSVTDQTLVANSIKATFLMMLYNLAEAVVVSTIHEIFVRVDAEALGYDHVAEEIRAFWLDRRMWQIREGRTETHARLVKEAIDSALEKRGLSKFSPEEVRKGYSGNVDARVIRSVAAAFDVPLKSRPSGQGGSRLLQIKKLRNDLGHGTFSFSEIGADQSPGELRETSIRVRRFLADAVVAFDHYLDSRRYATLRNG